MAIITDRYDPKQGVTVISGTGSQRFTENMDYFSQVFASVYSSDLNNKFAIDSCWESGNIYYANYDEGYVKKICFDGTVLASLALTNPLALSIFQYSDSMRTVIPDPPQDDRGCWIIDEYMDGFTKVARLVFTDHNLNIVKTIDPLTNPICVIPAYDGGCYVADQTLQSISRYSSSSVLLGTYTFLGIYPKELALDLSNVTGNLWVLCSDDKVYNFSVTNTGFTLRFSISPIVFGSHVGAIDVDRNSTLSQQYLYVTGGSRDSGWIKKYDKDGGLITSQTGLAMPFPYVLKAVQGYGSDRVYVLADFTKWDNYGYDSSSSSSTEIRSSSSSNSSSSSSSSSPP